MIKYKDFIGSGDHHKAYQLDDNWVLKTMITKQDMNTDLGKERDMLFQYDNMKDAIKAFKYHIDIMKKYPMIFPKVKRLDKYRAAIEKVDVEAANKELEYLFNILCSEVTIPDSQFDYLIHYLIQNEGNSLSVLKNIDDKVCEKWYEFILLLQIFSYNIGDQYIDVHNGNIGIDKEGNIKLIDF